LYIFNFELVFIFDYLVPLKCEL